MVQVGGRNDRAKMRSGQTRKGGREGDRMAADRGSPKAEGSREAAEEPQLISSVCVTRRPPAKQPVCELCACGV